MTIPGEAAGKVLVIGIDGGTFDVLSPLMDSGAMPNLRRLRDTGMAGPLRSVIPPVTAPAWVSFMTGSEPGRHGIFDFLRPDGDGMSRRVIHAKDILAPTLWDIMIASGRTMGAFNVPVTYPPQRVKGFMWSGLLTPPRANENGVYPRELYAEMEKVHGRVPGEISLQAYPEQEKTSLIRDLTAAVTLAGDYTTYLMKKYDWDLFMAVITETDRMQHTLGPYLFGPEATADDEEAAGIRRRLVDFYREVDRQVGRYCELAGPAANVVVLSDHGFGTLNRGFAINQWLERQGLLQVKHARRLSFAVKLVMLLRHPEVRRLGGRILGKRLKRKVARRTARATNPNLAYHRIMKEYVDWSRTKAFMDVGTQQGVYINVRGRQPYGIVEPGAEYEKTRDDLIARLRDLRDPDTGAPLATHVYRREEVYSGPYAENGPDVVFLLDGLGTLAVPVMGVGKSDFVKPFWPILSHHRMDGIFMASGPSIRRGSLEGGRLIDVMPTVLHALGEKIPAGLDGRVLTEVFTDSFAAAHPVEFVDGAAMAHVKDESFDLTDADNQALEEQLRSLGYLG